MREIFNNGTLPHEQSPWHFWDAGCHGDDQKQVAFPWWRVLSGVIVIVLLDAACLTVSSSHPYTSHLSPIRSLYMRGKGETTASKQSRDTMPTCGSQLGAGADITPGWLMAAHWDLGGEGGKRHVGSLGHNSHYRFLVFWLAWVLFGHLVKLWFSYHPHQSVTSEIIFILNCAFIHLSFDWSFFYFLYLKPAMYPDSRVPMNKHSLP